jgi:hypothetical protein
VETGADGDYVTEETIRQAMYWWMEYGNHQLMLQHTALGGSEMSNEDIALLECWQSREDGLIDGQAVKKGTWLLSARIRNPTVWMSIKEGLIKGWSIEAKALSRMVDSKDFDAGKLPPPPVLVDSITA